MVVSDIGEQWSPNTLPASVAAREATSKSGQMACATGIMIGIKIPNVPQDVPVAKLSVGTTFKKDGKFENRVDVNRVKEFMQVVHEFREQIQ